MNESYTPLSSLPRLWILVLATPHYASGLPALTLHAGLPTFIAPRYSEKQPCNFYHIQIYTKIDFFQNSLCLKKLMIFERIYYQILKAYVYIWSKNLVIKPPKRPILASKWSFERSLIEETVIKVANERLRPFSASAQIKCRSYSYYLQRAIVDFGADVSFQEAQKKLLEHYR